MPSTTAVSSIACVAAPLSAVDVDLLIVPWFDDEGANAVDGLDAASNGEIARALSSKEFSGKTFDLFAASIVDRSWRAQRLLLVGAGASADVPQRAGAADCRGGGDGGTESPRRPGRVRVARPGDAAAEMAQAVAEGLTLSEFNVGVYKTGDPAPPAAPAMDDRVTPNRPSMSPIARASQSIAAGCSPSAAISRASWRTSQGTP